MILFLRIAADGCQQIKATNNQAFVLNREGIHRVIILSFFSFYMYTNLILKSYHSLAEEVYEKKL
jgi:hypothetical protein